METERYIASKFYEITTELRACDEHEKHSDAHNTSALRKSPLKLVDTLIRWENSLEIENWRIVFQE